MSKIKFILPAAIAVAGFLVSPTSSNAKATYTAKTKKACAFCHVDSKSKPTELTDDVMGNSQAFLDRVKETPLFFDLTINP